MKCILKNTCDRKEWCCNFCDKKKCQIRCNDDCKKCKWFKDEIIVEEEEEENDTNTKPSVRKIVEVKK